MMARYWRFRVPGGRYASSLPASVGRGERDAERLREWAAAAALHATMTSRSFSRRLRSVLDAPGQGEADRQLVELDRALAANDLPRARDAAAALASLGSPLFAAQRRREVVATVAVAVAAAMTAWGVRAQWVESYKVLSGSMVPTLETGDHIAGRRVAYTARTGPGPSRGDVVVFRSAAVTEGRGDFPDVFVKRVVGLPGDRITMNGSVPVINGWEVPTCRAGRYFYVLPDGEGSVRQALAVVEFLEDRAYLTLHFVPAVPFAGAYDVKPGEVFVLGDNRANSLDSRAYGGGSGGGVPFEAIEAQARWFLLGTHRSGEADLSRLFKPMGRLEGNLRLEGIDAKELEGGVDRCLQRRPAATYPPPPVPSSRRDTQT
jgi:signal peptidase I